ncbi:MAG: PorT family protein [Bacteroidetes bacterium]|nr:PorT family protein [Bacteroidota bacterium]
MLKIINFYNWYKGKFNDLSNNPPGEVWNTIANTLDKGQKPLTAKFLNWRMAAILLLLITIGSAALLFNIQSEQGFLADSTNNKEIDELISQKKNKINQKEVTNSSTQFPVNNLQPTISNIQYPTPNIQHPTSNTQYQVSGITPILVKGLVPTANMNKAILNHNNENSLDSVYHSELLRNNASIQRGIYFGTFFTFNNTWLLNHDTYNGLKSSELDETNIDFGNAYGLTVGYQFKEKLAIQGEWLIHTSHGQKYKYYDQGKRNNKEIILKYTQFNLLVKYKRMSFNRRHPISANFVAGPYISILNSAEKSINGVSSSKTDISKYDHGMVLGIEYETQVIKRLNLFAGIRLNLGVKNIYTGDGNIPASFNKTTNSALGITAGINYRIPVK